MSDFEVFPFGKKLGRRLRRGLPRHRQIAMEEDIGIAKASYVENELHERVTLIHEGQGDAIADNSSTGAAAHGQRSW